MKDEILKDEQLDEVTGGSWIESYVVDLQRAYTYQGNNISEDEAWKIIDGK